MKNKYGRGIKRGLLEGGALRTQFKGGDVTVGELL